MFKLFHVFGVIPWLDHGMTTKSTGFPLLARNDINTLKRFHQY
ncbi:hypothetical protein [Rickettsia tamurae]|nr:hypothetical protein [Rickettsia tamurae]